MSPFRRRVLRLTTPSDTFDLSPAQSQLMLEEFYPVPAGGWRLDHFVSADAEVNPLVFSK